MPAVCEYNQFVLASTGEHVDGRYLVVVGSPPWTLTDNLPTLPYSKVALANEALTSCSRKISSAPTDIHALHVWVEREIVCDARIVLFEADLDRIRLKHWFYGMVRLTGHLAAFSDHFITFESTIVAGHEVSSSRGMFPVSRFVQVLKQLSCNKRTLATESDVLRC